jgi:hypothetical protein
VLGKIPDVDTIGYLTAALLLTLYEHSITFAKRKKKRKALIESGIIDSYYIHQLIIAGFDRISRGRGGKGWSETNSWHSSCASCAMKNSNVKREKSLISVPLAAVITIVLCGVAEVQPVHGQEVAAEQQTLRSFAKAYLAVEQIRQSYLPKLGETDDIEQSRTVEAEAQGKITEAISREGLTAERYREIVKTANGDYALRVQLMQMIDKERRVAAK